MANRFAAQLCAAWRCIEVEARRTGRGHRDAAQVVLDRDAAGPVHMAIVDQLAGQRSTLFPSSEPAGWRGFAGRHELVIDFEHARRVKTDAGFRTAAEIGMEPEPGGHRLVQSG